MTMRALLSKYIWILRSVLLERIQLTPKSLVIPTGVLRPRNPRIPFQPQKGSKLATLTFNAYITSYQAKSTTCNKIEGEEQYRA